MTKVRVIGVSADDPALKELLDEADCEVLEGDDEDEATDEVVAGEEEAAVELAANDHCDDGLVIVILTPECVGDEDLPAVVNEAVGRGCRVIGVWPQGIDGGVVPPCIEQMGHDVIVWNPDPLRRVVRGEKPQWQTPKGEPRPEPKSKRNCC